MEIFGKFFILFQIVISQLGLFVNFMIFRHWNEMTGIDKLLLLLEGSITQFAWICVLEVGGRFNQNSILTIKSWKNLKAARKNESKYFRKFVKSCRPLFVGAQGYLVIKRLSILKFLKGTSRATLRALLATK
jgi:hypothetical protein